MSRAPNRRRRAGLRVSVSDGDGRRLGAGPGAGLAVWLSRAVPGATRGEVAIAIVSDAAMRRLNRFHRGVNRPTDVLSFPAEAPRSGRSPGRPGARASGDLAIARGVAARQAKAAGHSVGTEFRILALHGLLHLLGYDHEADKGEMERVEERLRRRAGLPTGLIVRVTRSGRLRHA